MSRFGWQPSIEDYGAPRYGLTDQQWRALCRLHQRLSAGQPSPLDRADVPPRLRFFRDLYRKGLLHDR